MTDSSMKLATKMEALKNKYLSQLETKIEALRLFAVACEKGTPDPDMMQKTMDIAHKLAGSGATYGFLTISNTAQTLDDLLNAKPMVASSVLAVKTKLLLEACVNAHGSLPLAPPSDVALAIEEPQATGGLPVILLVEDDETIRQMVAHVFSEDAQVVMAKNGREGLDVLERLTPAIILLDDAMPELGGIEFLEEIRKRQDQRKFQIIMLTANRKNADVIMAFRFGIADYISKPFEPTALRTRVMDFIARNRRKILIADDDPAIRDLLGAKFRALGYQVVLADDCDTAFNRTLSEKPDLLVLDRMLPGGDGLALYLKLKSWPDTLPIPTIFLTAKRRESDILEALKQGAQDYVVKPFKADEVVARCVRLLNAIKK